MSEPTYRIELTHDPASGSAVCWTAKVYAVADDSYYIADYYAATRESAFDKAQAFCRAKATVFLTEDGRTTRPVRHGADVSVQHAESGSTVHAESGSTVHARSGSTVHARSGSTVHARSGSTVHARSGSTVHAWSGSTVHAWSGSTVHAESGSTVHAESGSTVHARSGSTVHARSGSTVVVAEKDEPRSIRCAADAIVIREWS